MLSHAGGAWAATFVRGPGYKYPAAVISSCRGIKPAGWELDGSLQFGQALQTYWLAILAFRSFAEAYTIQARCVIGRQRPAVVWVSVQAGRRPLPAVACKASAADRVRAPAAAPSGFGLRGDV